VRLLVTGLSGFVGAHVADAWRAGRPGNPHGFDATLFGLTRPHGTAERLPPGAQALIADLDDAAAVRAAVAEARPDAVLHLAGQSSVHQSWSDPGATLRTNVLGASHLLEAIQAEAPRARVVVVGSAEEYGAVPAERQPIREDEPLRPRSPYAVSKAAQGLLALQHAAAGLAVTLCRVFPHTGPGRGEAFAESSWARQLAEIEAGLRSPVIEVGNLEAVRDFTDVRDVAAAYLGLLAPGAPTGTFNVCSGHGVAMREVLDRLVRLSGQDVEVRVDRERLRPADVPCLVGDPARLRAATGWAPRSTLDRTLGDLLDDARARLRARREPR
jgi:GDP-4-dehydro-6-deoxy-D-mannose reductase